MIGRLAQPASPISTSTNFVGRLAKPSAPTVKTTVPQADVVEKKTFKPFLGGGSYYSVKNQPNKLAKAPVKSQSALPVSKDTERHHIVPDSAGGTSDLDNLIPLNEKEHARVTKVGNDAMNLYRAGQITLPEVRLKTQTELQTILAEREGIYTSVWKNLPKAFIDTAKKGAKVVVDTIISSEKKAASQIGDALASVDPDYKAAVKSQAALDDANLKLAKQIGVNKKAGKDTSRLVAQLKSNYEGKVNAGEIIPNLDRTPLQNIADWAGVAVDVLTAGVGGGATKVGREAAGLGAAYGLTGYLQDEKNVDLGEAALSTAAGAAGGLLLAKGGQFVGRLSNTLNKNVQKGITKAEVATEANVSKVLDKGTNPILNKETSQIGADLTAKTADKKIVPMQDIIPKTEIPAGSKESKFAKTLAYADSTDPNIAKGLKENPAIYEVQKNAEVQKKALERIKTNQAEAENFVLTATEPSAEHTATAVELIKKMQNEGNFNGAIRIADDVSLKLTKAGQAIQARKLYENLSPESILVKAKTFINKENQKATIFSKAKSLTEEDAKALYETAKAMQSATGDAKTELSSEIASILADYQHNTIGKKLSSIQTQAQLLNPKTQVRNVIGNELFYRLERLTKMIAMPFDIARSKLTGTERTITMKTGDQGQYWQDFFKGAKAGWQGKQLGPDTQFQLPNHTFNNKWNPFYWGERAVGASLKSFDYAAYNRARLNTIYELGYLRAKKELGDASKEKISKLADYYAKNVDDKILQIADDYGKYVTFQDDNVISQMAIGIKKGLNKKQFGGDFGLGDLVLKYPKTPGALMARALEYSPAGFLKFAKEIATPALMGKVKTQAEKREFAMTIARSIVGTFGFTGLGYYFADKGFITGKMSKDKDVASIEKGVGKNKYQINLSAIKRWVMSGFNNTKTSPGDYLYTYDWAQPVAVSLSIGANMNLGSEEGLANGTFDLGQEIAAGANTITEQPLLSGLTRMFGYGDLITGAKGVVEGLPASFTPTLANQFRQYIDNQKRDTKGTDSVDTAMNLVKNKIPGQSETLPPKYDVTGQPVKNFENPNIFNIFLNPGNLTTFKETPESKLVLDLIESTGETKQVPRVLPDKQTIFGKEITLDRKDYSVLQKYAGEKTMQGLENLLKDEDFNKQEDATKVDIVANALSKVGKQVKALLQARELMKLNKEGNIDEIRRIQTEVGPTETQQIQSAIDFLRENPDFFKANMNPLPKEEKKKSSSMLEGGGLMVAGLGLSAITHGKGNKIIAKGADKFLAEEGSKLAVKAAEKEADLLAVHSTTAKALTSIVKDGKIYGPSVAIFNKEKALPQKSFGDYHVVINKNAINPAKKDVLMYTDDIYSPRLVTDEESLKRMQELIKTGGSIKGAEVRGNLGDSVNMGSASTPIQATLAERVTSFLDLKNKSSKLGSREEARKSYLDRMITIESSLERILPKEAKIAWYENMIGEKPRAEDLKTLQYGQLAEEILSVVGETKDKSEWVGRIQEVLEIDYGMEIAPRRISQFIDSVNNTVNNVKVEYFEAKALKALDVRKDIDTILAPRNDNEELIKKLQEAGKKVVFYDKYENADYTNKSLKDALANVSKYAFGIGIINSKPNVWTKNPYNTKVDKDIDKSVAESKDPVVKRLSMPTKGEGTYYDPKDANQTKKNPDGKGAYGRMIESGSIAFGNRYFHDDLKAGKLIYVKIPELASVKTPYGDGIFRIDDTMNPRYNKKGQFNIDFNHTDKIPDALRKKGRFPLTFKIVKIEDPA